MEEQAYSSRSGWANNFKHKLIFYFLMKENKCYLLFCVLFHRGKDENTIQFLKMSDHQKFRFDASVTPTMSSGVNKFLFSLCISYLVHYLIVTPLLSSKK